MPELKPFFLVDTAKPRPLLGGTKLSKARSENPGGTSKSSRLEDEAPPTTELILILTALAKLVCRSCGCEG